MTGGVKTFATFLLIMAPVYYLFRVLAKLAREEYGFGEAESDQGPPLRVCVGCRNTVLEADFVHCPYCGRVMDTIDSSVERRPA